MSNPGKIKSKTYRNWVRGALGLFYVQKGLYPFTDRVVKTEHAKVVQNLTPCTGCTIENILPDHARRKVCIQRNKAKCNCRKKTNTNCAICGKIYDEIIFQHRFDDPHWVTDCSTWYSDHWQFAKCFLTTTNKGSNNTAAETDASGLLSIIINGLFFQAEIQCNIDGVNDLFSQVRGIRNEILHNSTLDLTDQEVARYLKSMIAVLEDKTTLSMDPAAQGAVIKLKEILNDELIITMNEEANVIQTALDAIMVAKEQSEDSIRKLGEEKQNALKVSEENIKKITEASQNVLQQQTSESATEIKTVSDQAMANVADTVSTVFEETYEPEIEKLKQDHDAHEKRLNAVEAKQQNLQLKQNQLENQVAELKQQVDKLTDIEGKHQMRIEYLKRKQGLQQYLVKEYQRHHVKTWISPLMTQNNDVNIRDVYVSPRMVVEENKDGNDGNTTEVGKVKETKHTNIERYRDLFSTQAKQNRNIFILGDVGTGKSSFCKMMMQNWCSAITKRNVSDDPGATEEKAMKPDEACNTYAMNQFDFLFYVPLREMPDNIDDTVDMIKVQLKGYKEQIDDIFENESERVLILADGLDEWTPSSIDRPPSLRHVTTGIPKSRAVSDSTIVITSRPSSRGILNMKSSEYDLKVTLKGLDYASVDPMIANYMTLLNKTSDISDFKEKLSNLNLKDVQNAPLLLQQIIWLYCKGYDIGQSISVIYINIVNIVLGWEHERMGCNPMLHEFQNSEIEQLPLPKCFDKFVRCQENRKLLLLLGRLAYDAYVTGSDSSLVFGRYKLKQLGVSEDGISAVLRTGILTEVNSADPTYEKSRLSFIHTSYMEFFAALYMCSCYLWKITVDHSSGTPLTVLESIIAVTQTTSIAEILRLENVFQMTCGLVPCLTKHICECIFNVSLDKNMDNFGVYKIQKLMFDCLSEHNSADQETVEHIRIKLRHFRMRNDDGKLEMYLYGLDPTCIETCNIWFTTVSQEQHSLLSTFVSEAVSLKTIKLYNTDCEGIIIGLTNQRKLQSLKLRAEISVSGINTTCLETCEISHCKLSHEQCSLLSLYLSQTVSLHTLEIDNVRCTKDKCEGHYIDLTNKKKLHSIELSNSYIKVSGINHSSLKSCRIDNCELSHEHCSLLLSCLSRAVLLKTLEMKKVTCTTDECEGHYIDLTYLGKLQSIELSESKISVTGINLTCLESSVILYSRLSHEQCASLPACISQATSLQSLHVFSPDCTKSERGRRGIDGHDVDLTNHNQLPRCLKKCVISNQNLPHEECASLCTFLSHTEALLCLELSEIKCIKTTCDGHSIDLTYNKQLQELSISNCNMMSIIGINPTCLKECDISNQNLPHEECSSLCTSLLHAEYLEKLKLSKIQCTKGACEGHDIDLTNHNQLDELTISKCNIISITGINPTCLKKCDISNCSLSHEQYASLCTILSHAESLKNLDLREIKCTDEACAGHDVDLTNHNQLDTISISNCTKLSITGINPTCPVYWFDISNFNLSHKQYASLCTFLSHAESLKNLILRGIKCTDEACTGHDVDLTNHNQLYTISISHCTKLSITGINPTCPVYRFYISNCNLSHKQYASLCTFLSHAESLKNLDLSDIKCTDDACAGHDIDLTSHKQLKELSISNCNMISITGINPTCLKKCDISNRILSHEQYTSLCTPLSQAEHLKKLTLSEIKCTDEACAGHDIDLTSHKQLKELSISNCNMISITGINPTCLKECSIRHCNLSHKQYASLCTFLSHADSLNYLELRKIKCTDEACAGHDIDLTNYKQLEELTISNCNMISITGINPTCPKKCDISNQNLQHEQCTSLCTYLSHTEALLCLKLSEIKCIQTACDDHSIDLTYNKQLEELSISKCNMISITGINPTCLKKCDISNRILSHEQYTSLCTPLSQAEHLKKLTLSEIKCTDDACEGHDIDLTNHNQVKELSISNCNKISITGINPTCSVKCDISNRKLSHEQCTSLCTFLSRTESLNYLTLSEIKCTDDACEGHDIDLTNYKQLKELSISNCNIISITGINPTCSVKCDISNRKLSHEQCTSLCTFLSRTESLNYLTLSEIKCTDDACEGHDIDLTNYNQLKELSISNCNIISITGINPTCLVNCGISNRKLSHEQCTSLCTFLSRTESLNYLTLSEIKCTDDACEGHDIDLTNYKQLKYLSISKCNMISITRINRTCPIWLCHISNRNLSHEQCTSLCTFLSKAITLKFIILREVKCTKDRCEGHYIDLSNHKWLDCYSISDCNNISSTGR